ncbi:hypothetical protein [Pseudomonas chlororaphis]|uniref:hypothetical protein n=1 Tax=Pseudomonas chlororaphis TaxID=587753 RepID=UPI0039E2EA0B
MEKPKMTGNDTYEVLKKKGINHLFHANSLTTSLSLLRLKGLASRNYVESAGLSQTAQYTDNLDKVLGVWGDIFLDTVDIHQRASNLNHYGPILFVIDSQMVKSAESVLITKTNPSKWSKATPFEERYFTTLEELEENWIVGNFDQMLTLQTREGIIPFSDHLLNIIIDDPAPGNMPSNEFNTAEAEISKLTTQCVIRRQCAQWCKCKTSYEDKRIILKMFTA